MDSHATGLAAEASAGLRKALEKRAKKQAAFAALFKPPTVVRVMRGC